MDLGAYVQIELLEKLLPSQPPRIRGLRLMKYQEKTDEDGLQMETFDNYCGQDVLYIHTRCGSCGDDNDPDYNYVSCGLKEWEEEHADLVLDSVNEEFDCTYRDTYISIPQDKMEAYNNLIKEIEASE